MDDITLFAITCGVKSHCIGGIWHVSVECKNSKGRCVLQASGRELWDAMETLFQKYVEENEQV